MNFTKGRMYRVTETAGALVIHEPNQKVRDLTAKSLIIADAGACLTYLDRYFFEREKGTDRREAHEKALATAQITVIRPQPDNTEPKPEKAS